MANFPIPSGAVFTLDTVIGFDSHPPDQTVSLTDIPQNRTVKVTLTFQHRAVDATTTEALFRNGFFYFIEADPASQMKHLGGGGTAELKNAVQAHLGWTTASTVGYFLSRPNAPTFAQFTMRNSPGDIGHKGAIENLVLSAEIL